MPRTLPTPGPDSTRLPEATVFRIPLLAALSLPAILCALPARAQTTPAIMTLNPSPILVPYGNYGTPINPLVPNQVITEPTTTVTLSNTLASFAITAFSGPAGITVDPNCAFGIATTNGLQLSGFAGGFGSTSLALSLEIPANTPPGNYNFTISIIDQDAGSEYYAFGQTICSATGTVVITGGQSIAVTANNQTMILGGPQPALTYTTIPSPLPAYDTLAGSLACSAGSAVGNFPITQGSLALTSSQDDILSPFQNGTMSVQDRLQRPAFALRLQPGLPVRRSRAHHLAIHQLRRNPSA